MADAYNASQFFRDQMVETQRSLMKEWTVPNLKLQTAATSFGVDMTALEHISNPGADTLKRIHGELFQPAKIPSLVPGYEPQRFPGLSDFFTQMQSRYKIEPIRASDFVTTIDTRSILDRVYQSWTPVVPWFDQVNPALRQATDMFGNLREAAASRQFRELVEEVGHHVPDEVQDSFLNQVVEPAAVELAEEQMQNPSEAFLERFEEIVAQIDTDEAPDVSVYLDPTDIVSQVQHTTGFATFSARFSHLSESRVAYCVGVCIVTSVLTTIMCVVPDDAQQVVNNWIAIFGVVTSIRPR